MKRFVCALIIAAFIFSFGCSYQKPDAMRIAVVKGCVYSYVLAPLMGREYSQQYAFTLCDSADEAYSLLISGDVDSALLPAEYAGDSGNAVAAAAVTLRNLEFVQKTKTMSDINSLNGAELLIPYSVWESAEYSMLTRLIDAAGVSVTLTPVDDADVIPALLDGSVSVAALSGSLRADALAADDTLVKSFSLQSQWTRFFDLPVAESCIFIEKGYLDAHTAACEAFLRDCEASCAFIGTKHSKAAMIVCSYGLCGGLSEAKRAIRSCTFAFLTPDGFAVSESGCSERVQ